jgi:hypothetical protein
MTGPDDSAFIPAKADEAKTTITMIDRNQ